MAKHGIGATAALLAVATLAFACGEEPKRSSDDDDDTAGVTVSASSGAAQSGAGGGGGSATTSSGSGGGATSGTGGSGGVPILPGDLVITEIMNNPASVLDSNGEWFELKNVSDGPVDLQGLVIRHRDDASSIHTITDSIVIGPAGYAVLGRNASTSSNGGVQVDYVYDSSVSLNNTFDYLAIETSDTTIIDATSWDEVSGLDPDGASRSLDPQFASAAMNDDDTNYCEASSLMAGGDLGTPGAANDNCF